MAVDINRLETVRSGTITLDGRPLPEAGTARRRGKGDADGPACALGPEMTDEVPEVMRQLARDGMTMVVVTHEMGFPRAFADRVVFTAGGRIVEGRAPEEFSTTPRSERTH